MFFWQTISFLRCLFWLNYSKPLFLKKNIMLVCLSQRIQYPIQHFFKNKTRTHFQATRPWEGPVQFSGLVAQVWELQKLFTRWSWAKRKNDPLQKQVPTSNKGSNIVLNLLRIFKKNITRTNFHATRPWEGPVNFCRFVAQVRNCRKLFLRWSWGQEKTEKPFTTVSFSFSFSLSASPSLCFLFLFLFEPHSLQVLQVRYKFTSKKKVAN